MEGIEDEGMTSADAAPHAAAIRGLDAWLDAHVRDTAIARDTAAWNSIFSNIQQIKAAIAAVKEN